MAGSTTSPGRSRRGVLALAVAALSLVVVTPPVAAAAAPAPSRYRQVYSRYFNAPAHGQGYGRASCPSGTRVVGGGVFASFSDITQVVTATYPSDDGRAWLARFSNTLDTDTQFRVIAVCLAGVRDYAIVRGRAAPAPPEADHPAVAAAGCPAGTVVLAGGAGTDSASTGVVLAAESPTRDTHGWRAFYNNRSRATVPVAAYAVCGHPLPGYTVLTGPPTAVRAHGTDTALAVCDPSIVVLGSGGMPVGGPSLHVDVNSVFVEGPPVGEVYLSNRTGTALDIVAMSICADVG